jgi:hypothetical protein
MGQVPFPIRSLDNPSSSNMAFRLTQPLTEMAINFLPGGKGRPAPKADILAVICELTTWKMLEPRRLTTL